MFDKLKITRDKIYYVVILLTSVLLLIIGSLITGNIDATDTGFSRTYTGVVQRLANQSETMHWVDYYFEVRLVSGGRSGDVVQMRQRINNNHLGEPFALDTGSRVIVAVVPALGENPESFTFITISRINQIIVLALFFLALSVVLGRAKGLNGIVSLALTCLAIIAVFIPAALSGANIYVIAILICAYAIVSTLLLVIGINKKSFSAMLGCLGGVLAAGLIMVIANLTLQLTGLGDHEAMNLYALNPGLNMRALIFAGIIFGAVGAIMDVSMSIASSLWELREVGGVRDFKQLMKSGMEIGRDTLGTMLNTLVLAYMGGALVMVFWLMASDRGANMIFNMEIVIAELLRALIGGFGMLLTIPLTALICAWFFTGEKDKAKKQMTSAVRKFMKS